MGTQRTELEQKMINRVRTHMLVSFAGILGGGALIGIVGGIIRSATDGHPGGLGFLPGLGVFLIPAIGFWSTFKFLRCPSCDRLVAMQVSWNYSLFSSWAQKTCQGCGQKIFADDIARRFGRTLIIMVVIAVLMGFGGGLAAMSRARHAPPPAPATNGP